MWSFIIIWFGFLTSVAFGADHNVFKNCSRVSFCSSFRDKTLDPNSQFEAKIADFRIVRKVAIIPLQNAQNQTLNLHVSVLADSTLRVKVLEDNHSRYELADVLVTEPEALTIKSLVITSSTISLGTSDGLNEYRAEVSAGPPFSVKFYFQNHLEVVLNGDRLTMESSADSKAFAFDVAFQDTGNLFGLFNHAHELTLAHTADGSMDPFRLRNSDTSNYEVNSPMALYGSVPVIYGHSATYTFGVFLHNAAEQWVDISYTTSNISSAYFMVESGTLDLFVMLGPTPKELIRQYTGLTGVAPLPQLWTLGYHQSRYSYATQEEVEEVVANMDKYDFPLEAVWLDIDYTDAKKYFTWNPDNFSDPISMQNNLAATGRKIVTILDPHIKVDPNYPVYAGGEGKYFVKWANGSDFEGDCWPGASRYIDFLNPEARDYYAGWYSYDKFNGTTETIAGVWNDMNEPSVFDDSLEKTLPFGTLHYGDVEHRDVHNIYGLLQTKATYQGLMQRDNGTTRPFILTRSHFAGSQRYAAMWTGDNTADWSYLATSYSQCLTASLLGVAWCGADVGGFFGNPDDELIQRWYQAAIWLPFFRGHANKDTNRREPYVFSGDVQSVIRNAIKMRYKHLPVWYTAFYEHTRFGDPVIRPLFYHFPTFFSYDDHLMLGDDILVRPVLEANVSEVLVTFPTLFKVEHYYRVDDDSWKLYTGGTKANVSVDINESPVFYRAGSIIARKDREKHSTSDMTNDPYTFYVNSDTINMAEGRLYIDDFTTFNYVTQKSYLYIALRYLRDSNAVHFEIIDGDSSGIGMTLQRIVVHGPASTATFTTTSDGTPLDTIDIGKRLNMRSEGLTLYL